MTPIELVTFTIDGREVQAPAGELVIKAAQDHGVFIPRFCWHERMKPVGMCRMCLVEVEGTRGLPPACTTPIADGMEVRTRTDAVRKAQDGVLELLLINHPLDCPVCDRGGECPLQDQTVAFGPGESRFVEEKRHFAKPVPISDLVLLDRERCIQCGRCTRFADEIAGDPLIDFAERSGEMQVVTFPDEPFTSYFSGNTVQICPVGALTATPYRFRARPWDLATVETSCTACAVGCRGALQSSSDRLVRLLGVDSEPVNHGWLCDKGRFGYEWAHSPDRVRHPLVRRGDELVEASWPEALDAASTALRGAIDEHGPGSIAVLGGGRGTNEDAYVWARLAKAVIGTDHVDAQLGDGLPAELVLGVPRATIADCDRASVILLLAPDLREELPVLFLRLRRAAVELGVPLIDVSAREHGLSAHAAVRLPAGPGEAGGVVGRLAGALGGSPSGDEAVDAAAALVDGRDGPVVVVLGRASLAEPAAATVEAAAALAGLDAVRFLSALPRSNVHGALDLGLAPGFVPGRVRLDRGREWAASGWGVDPASMPQEAGLDAAGILAAAASGALKVLVLLGADPLASFPDRARARAALDSVDTVIALDAFRNQSNEGAAVFLPVTLWGEKSGSATNLEGRVQRLGAAISPAGTAMDDWRIAVELALRLDADFDLASVEEVQDEIARVAPAHAGIDASLLRRARDGAVVPLSEHRDELVLHGPGVAPTGVSWEPIRPGVVASEEMHGSGASPSGVAGATGTGAIVTVKPGMTELEGSEADDDEAVDALVEQAEEAREGAPDLHEWDLTAPPVTPVPRDAYSLRLVSGRTLYGSDRLTASSPSLAEHAAGATLQVSRQDFERLGVSAGDTVRVTVEHRTRDLPVHPDSATPSGLAFVAFNQTDPGAADLIDLDAPVTDLRVETIA